MLGPSLSQRISLLSCLTLTVAALSACDRPERGLSPPPVLKSTAPVAASDTTLYYDYQHKPVMLALDPSRVVVEATSDPGATAASVLQSLGVSITSTAPLVQAHGHWLLHLASGLSAASAHAAADALHADGRFTFVSNVYRTIQDNSDIVPVGRLAVQFKAGVAPSQVDSLTRAFGLALVRPARPDSGFSYYLFSYPRDSVAPLRVAVALDRNPLVEWADPDKISSRHADYIPSDPYFSLQYYLSNTITLNGIPVDDNVETAWDLTTGLWPPSTGGLRVGVIGTACRHLTQNLVVVFWMVMTPCSATAAQVASTVPRRRLATTLMGQALPESYWASTMVRV